FKNAHFYVHDDEYSQGEFSFSFNSSSLKVDNYIKTTMSIADGTVTYEKNKYIENIATDVSVTKEFVGDTFDIKAQIAGTCVLSHMAVPSGALCERWAGQGACYVTGVWKSDRGRFSIRNAYNSLIIDPIIIT